MAIKIHEERYQRQLKGIDRWRKAKDLNLSHSNGWGTLWWETGTGKTFAACLVIQKMLNSNNAYSFIVVVPGEELEKQWKEAINSYLGNVIINIQVLTVHKVMELTKEGSKLQCSLLIADELHEYYTDDRLEMFNSERIMTNYCLGLTANYLDFNNRHKFIEEILPVVDRIDEEEAVREGYIAKFVEYNVPVEFTAKEYEVYSELSKKVSKNLSKFGGNGLELANKVLSGNSKTGENGYSIACRWAAHHGWSKGMNLSEPGNIEIFNQWSPQLIVGYAKQLMDSVRERKTLLYTTSGKIRLAKEVVIKFKDLKTICFSQSTLFADALCSVINNHYSSIGEEEVCVAYHSQLSTLIIKDEVTGKEKKKGKTILKREAIEAIRSGKKRVISTASSLDRGFDVKDIRLAITTSGTQNPTQYNQRRGRAVRAEHEEPDVIKLIINLYVRGTIEERWLKKRQSKTKSVIYYVDSIDDLTYNPKDKNLFNLKEI